MTSTFSPAELDAILCNDLMSFVERVFYELSPQATFSMSFCLEAMATALMESIEGGCRRLIINLPPRSLKSIMCSVALPAMILGRDPSKQIICASYGQALADKHARDTRTIIMSPFYKRLFPRTRLSSQKLSIDDFITTQQGGRMATSVGGVLTGRGADFILIDDPQKPDEALSETRRTAVNEWYDNTLLSRLNSKEKGVIILIMQRLHQDDLVGHVLEQEDWKVLSFPAIAEEDERYLIVNPFGRRIHTRKKGEVLNPERESLHTLLAMKRTMGEYNFANQYQQNPTPAGGAMVKTAWLKIYDPLGPLPRFSSKVQSWDTATKSGELNDYSVCTTWGVYDGRYYLLEVFRERLEYPDLKRAVLRQISAHNPNIVLIEDKSSGTQLIQELKAAGQYRVKPYAPPPQTDKVMRLHSQTAKIEGGYVLLPSSAPWLQEYVHEMTTFPGTKYDDQVDSTTQALDYMDNNNSLDIWTRLGRGY